MQAQAREVLQAIGTVCHRCLAPVAVGLGRHSTGIVRLHGPHRLNRWHSRYRGTLLLKELAAGRAEVLCRSCANTGHRGEAATL
jgi:hypothetical protein